MPDYKEMYLTMVRYSERAQRLSAEAAELLIEAQRLCEEMYISSSEPEITLLTPPLSEIPPNPLP